MKRWNASTDVMTLTCSASATLRMTFVTANVTVRRKGITTVWMRSTVNHVVTPTLTSFVQALNCAYQSHGSVSMY